MRAHHSLDWNDNDQENPAASLLNSFSVQTVYKAPATSGHHVPTSTFSLHTFLSTIATLLQDTFSTLVALPVPRIDDHANRLIKGVLQALLRERTGLQVRERVGFLCHVSCLVKRDEVLLSFRQARRRLWVVPEVSLGSNKKVGDADCVVTDLWDPFRLDVFQRRRVVNRKADEKDVCGSKALACELGEGRGQWAPHLFAGSSMGATWSVVGRKERG
jgi:hypothetical protein